MSELFVFVCAASAFRDLKKREKQTAERYQIISVIGINQSEMVSGQTQSSQPRDRQSIIWLLDKMF